MFYTYMKCFHHSIKCLHQTIKCSTINFLSFYFRLLLIRNHPNILVSIVGKIFHTTNKISYTTNKTFYTTNRIYNTLFRTYYVIGNTFMHLACFLNCQTLFFLFESKSLCKYIIWWNNINMFWKSEVSSSLYVR